MYCVSPIYVRKHNINVPCGKCGACVKRRISDWVLRCQVESKRSLCYFVTLTYGINPIELYKKELQDFFKRLRKFGCEFRYFAVGDYGDTFERPHYHVLFFSKTSFPVQLDKIWQSGKGFEWRGFVDCKSVSFGRISYVVKYGLLAKLDWDCRREVRTAPFFLMSKGLGSCYCTKEMVSSHVYANRWWFQDGKYKRALPRYLRDKVFNVHQRELHKLEYDCSFEEKRDLVYASFCEQGFTAVEAQFKYEERVVNQSDQYLSKLRSQKKLKNKLL